MNTITLDNKTYKEMSDFARQNNYSISDVVKAGLNLLKAQFNKNVAKTSEQQYYISPAVKALETGFKCPEYLSEDYKKETIDSLSEKYL
jgi:hypothetical protein